MKENKESVMLNESDKSKYMMSKLGKRVAQMIGSFVNSKEDEGMTYTREDILSGIKSSTDMLAKKYPAVTDRYVNNCISYFIKKYGKNLSFLIEGRKKKGRMLNEDIEEPIEDNPEVGADVNVDSSSDVDDGRPEVEVIKTGRNRHGEFKVLRAKGGRYYIQYGEETYPVGSEHDAMKWSEILSIDENKHGKENGSSKDFKATNPDFWKKQHGYDSKKAEKASDWMSKHYSDLGETVKLDERKIRKIVAESVKRILKENNWRFDKMSNVNENFKKGPRKK